MATIDASATLAIAPTIFVVVGTTGGYTVDGYPTEAERARQEELGRELLGEWSPLLTGVKRQSRQGAHAHRGFGPEPPIQSEPGAHL